MTGASNIFTMNLLCISLCLSQSSHTINPLLKCPLFHKLKPGHTTSDANAVLAHQHHPGSCIEVDIIHTHIKSILPNHVYCSLRHVCSTSMCDLFSSVVVIHSNVKRRTQFGSFSICVAKSQCKDLPMEFLMYKSSHIVMLTEAPVPE